MLITGRNGGKSLLNVLKILPQLSLLSSDLFSSLFLSFLGVPIDRSAETSLDDHTILNYRLFPGHLHSSGGLFASRTPSTNFPPRDNHDVKIGLKSGGNPAAIARLRVFTSAWL